MSAEVDPPLAAGQGVEPTAEAILGLEDDDVEVAESGRRRESGGAPADHDDIDVVVVGEVASQVQEASHMLLKSALLGLTPVIESVTPPTLVE